MDLSFFTNPSDIRSYLHKPFLLDGRMVATNGWAMIAVPSEGEIEPFSGPAEVGEIMRKLLEKAEKSAFSEIPPYSIPPEADRTCRKCGGKKDLYECAECGGEGEVTAETEYNEYEVECKSCRGDGFVKANSAAAAGNATVCSSCRGTGLNSAFPVKVGSAYINFAMLEVIGALPGIEMDLTAHDKGDTVAVIPFRFNGGIGVVMPMRA